MQYVSRTVLPEAHEDGIWSVAWSPKGQIVTGACDEMVKTFTMPEQELVPLHTLKGHDLGVVSVSVASEGSMACSSALDSHIRLWDLDSGVELRAIDAGPVEAWTVSMSPDARLVASGSHGGNVNLWSTETGEKLQTLATKGKFIMSVAFSPDGSKVACGANDGAITVFDANTHKQIHKLDGHAMSVRALAFSKDSATLFSGSDDAHINMHDVNAGALVSVPPAVPTWPRRPALLRTSHCTLPCPERVRADLPRTPRRPARSPSSRGTLRGSSASPPPRTVRTSCRPRAITRSRSGTSASERRYRALRRRTPTKCGASRSTRKAAASALWVSAHALCSLPRRRPPGTLRMAPSVIALRWRACPAGDDKAVRVYEAAGSS